MEQEISGVIVVNKHKGVTSHDIVFKIRKLFGTKKVGHTGTLDPLATGVLPILVGRSAKAAEYLLSENKKYIAEIKLGITTDTQDITGKILTQNEINITKEQFFEACSHFVGDIKQVPPMYSALKVNGEKLVDLARKGVEIEREARDIKIYSIVPSVIDEGLGLYKIEVSCSKGTYIRTLCADIGDYLGCGATMKELERTQSGSFFIENSYTIKELEEIDIEKRKTLLMPTEDLFLEAPQVILPDFFAKLARSGCEIYQKKINQSYPIGTYVRMCDKNGFFALGQVKEYEGGSAIKALKLFVL